MAPFGSLTSLQQLILDSNQLRGTIPDSLGNLGSLLQLSVVRNQIAGTLPTLIGGLSSLQQLYLGNNQLVGTIPSSLSGLVHLKYLHLNNNQLNGTVPEPLGNLSHLLFLKIGTNRLIGTIPASLGNLISLQRLDVSDNALTGTIPASLGDLTSLHDLDVYSNQLYGSIPESLGNLTSLAYLQLYNNQISGTIPSNLGNLTSLVQLDLHQNAFVGTLPASFYNLTSLTVMDLSMNHLTGGFPPSWTTGGLQNLPAGGLQLQGNCLDITGISPSDVSWWNNKTGNGSYLGPQLTNCSVMACAAGRYRFNGSCVGCPRGHYCPDGGNVSVPCPQGTSTASAGQASLSACRSFTGSLTLTVVATVTVTGSSITKTCSRTMSATSAASSRSLVIEKTVTLVSTSSRSVSTLTMTQPWTRSSRILSSSITPPPRVQQATDSPTATTVSASFNIVSGALGAGAGGAASVAALDLLQCGSSLYPAIDDVVNGDSPLSYLISPWRRFGLTQAVVGNLVTVAAVVCVHTFVAAALYNVSDAGEPRLSFFRRLADVVLRWHTSGEAMQSCARVRFPALTLRLVAVLLPGTSLLSFGLAARAADVGSTLAGLIGVGLIGGLLVLLFRTVVWGVLPNSHVAPRATLPSSGPFLSVLHALSPRAEWRPVPLSQASGQLCDSAVDKDAAQFLLLQVHLLNVVVSGLAGLAAATTNTVACRGMSVLMGVLHAAAVVWYVTRRPFRSPVDSVAVPVQSSIVCVLCWMTAAGAERPAWLKLLQSLVAVCQLVTKVGVTVLLRLAASAPSAVGDEFGGGEPATFTALESALMEESSVVVGVLHPAAADLVDDPACAVATTTTTTKADGMMMTCSSTNTSDVVTAVVSSLTSAAVEDDMWRHVPCVAADTDTNTRRHQHTTSSPMSSVLLTDFVDLPATAIL